MGDVKIELRQAADRDPIGLAVLENGFGLKLSTWASFPMPKSFSLMRPISSTAVPSTNTSPKPPSA